jgi:hypothetical protein
MAQVSLAALFHQVPGGEAFGDLLLQAPESHIRTGRMMGGELIASRS